VFEDPAHDARPPASAPDDDLATLVTPVTPLETVSVRTELPLVDTRSSNLGTCPFLRGIDLDGALLRPIEAPDPANRCVAVNGPVPQSLRQQELVCLASGHVNCPRYLRGFLDEPAPPSADRGRSALTPAILGAMAVFAAAFVLSLAFVVGNGGLILTAAASPTGEVLGAEATPPPTATPPTTPAPTAAPTASAIAAVTASPSPSPTASPTPSPTPTPTPEPTPSPTPTKTPAPTPTPAQTSSRYALLTPCPNTPKCYIYVVRSGDNLFSIGKYFGVSVDSIHAMNPWTRTTGLKSGQQLRLPPPTR
jgi:LysM repeat protein